VRPLKRTPRNASKQLDDALSKNVGLEEKIRKLDEILRGVRDGSNILSVPPSAVARLRPSDPSRESSSSVSSVVDVRDNRKRDLSPSVPLHRALRTWDLYYGGSTIVQFVLHKFCPKHPRRF
jgi:hypothetical protein